MATALLFSCGSETVIDRDWSACGQFQQVMDSEACSTIHIDRISRRVTVQDPYAGCLTVTEDRIHGNDTRYSWWLFNGWNSPKVLQSWMVG